MKRRSAAILGTIVLGLCGTAAAKVHNHDYLVTGSRVTLDRAHRSVGAVVFCHKNGIVVTGGHYGANESVTKEFAFHSIVPGDSTQDWVVLATLRHGASRGWVQPWAKCRPS